MRIFRYSQWDETQAASLSDAEALMDRLAELLMQDGDFPKALQMIMDRGMTADVGVRIEEIRDLLHHLKEMREKDLQKYDLGSLLDDVREKLDQIVNMERETVEQQLEELAPPPDSSRDEAQPLLDRLSILDNLPSNLGEAVKELQKYDFLNQQAKEEFQQLLDQLQDQTTQSHFRDFKQNPDSSPQEQMNSLEEMLKELNEMLQKKLAGEEPDFDQFMDEHEEQLSGEAPSDLDSFLQGMQRKMAQLQSLMNSMPRSLRESLQSIASMIFGQQQLGNEVAQFTANLNQLKPMGDLDRYYPFNGNEPLSMIDALELMEKFQIIDELEKTLKGRQWSSDIRKPDPEKVRELLGEETHAKVEQLKQFRQGLEDQGYIRKAGERFELTPKGMRKIGQKALRDIFSSIDRGEFGKHESDTKGQGGFPIDDTKLYEYGDPFHVDITRSLMNTVIKKGTGIPVKIAHDDFEVRKTEHLSESSTVLLLDLSGSMERDNRFLAAKRVVLALKNLIESQFPRDSLHLVGFYTFARKIDKKELSSIMPRPFDFTRSRTDYFNLPKEMAKERPARGVEYDYPEVPLAYTNMQEGLRLSRKILSKKSVPNKQIIMITDAQPTAHFEGKVLFIQAPTTERTVIETLKEVRNCTRSEIRINTFMLARDQYLENFVYQLTRINKGRAFFTSPEHLGRYVVIDYLRGKKRKMI